MSKVRIKRGGTVVKVDWNTDDPTETPVEWVPHYLFDHCELEEGVTLRDIFLVLQDQIEIYEITIGNWVKEIVAEGLSGKEGKTDLDFLQLTWYLEHDVKKNELTGFIRPDFSGVGKGKDSDTTSFAVEFTPTYEMIDLPVKLNPEIHLLREEGRKWENTTHKGGAFTLGHVLHGIIWELSFMGGPADRDAQGKFLIEQVKGIEDGTIKTIPWEEAFPDLDLDEAETK